jgi:hypothetical protein
VREAETARSRHDEPGSAGLSPGSLGRLDRSALSPEGATVCRTGLSPSGLGYSADSVAGLAGTAGLSTVGFSTAGFSIARATGDAP